MRTGLWVLVVMAATVAAEVKTLTAATFETITQATTGSNGDWFVAFYAPSCPYFRELAPQFEQLSKQVKGKVNLGWVDGTLHSSLKDRFRVTRSPTMLLFHHGRMYSYKNARTVEDMEAFITTGFEMRDREMPQFKFYESVPPANNTSFVPEAPIVAKSATIVSISSIATSSKEEL
ncbi:hypothetical protein DYB35_006333 [Aphanomyces astaci]|uniref:Thioredoxin domain-containing protein n=1 Tax=Aphanomyces astaci TaxID=112090 RepID=A0A418DNP9_APHAT|nr:hypothetical protein DYB35_006333 [Aphanomyces astaci]